MLLGRIPREYRVSLKDPVGIKIYQVIITSPVGRMTVLHSNFLRSLYFALIFWFATYFVEGMGL